MLFKILLLTWILTSEAVELKSSITMDRVGQKGIYLHDYCPKNPFCAEGSHVMCMYYDPVKEFGPNCTEPRNVSITAVEAAKLLGVTNQMRSKLALGEESGSGPLPRAYGMFKLRWDNELATFAQVLANQCLVRHDMCRATKKFSDPGQTVGLIRFTSPDWFPAKTKKIYLKEPGLTSDKIMYAVETVLSSWYSHKKAVTADMIGSFPDWSLLDLGNDNGRVYLDMVYGPATHMGCGISAFTSHSYSNDKSKAVYNVILIVCNYSEGPRPSKPVYDLERAENSSPCGCPPNAVEDDNCLCSYEVDHTAPLFCEGIDCVSEPVLLPVITVENAPPSQFAVGRQIKQSQQSSKAINWRDKPATNLYHEQSSWGDKPATKLYHEQAPVASLRHVQPRKTSLFSRPVLLVTSKPNNALKLTLKVKDFKKDVVKRKDFSKAKLLANSYLEAVKNFTFLKYKFPSPESHDNISLNSAENEVIFNTANNTVDIKHNEIEDIEGDKDTTLMTLLDKLEEEVQHTELSGVKKELFDARIRKIYDSVVGKSGLPKPKAKRHFEQEHSVNTKREKITDCTSHEIETKKKENDISTDEKIYDVGKSIGKKAHSYRDETHLINLDKENDHPKAKRRRKKLKSRVDDGYNTDSGVGNDYDLQRRDDSKRNLQYDDIEYNHFTFPEHRQTYKNNDRDNSYENLKMRYMRHYYDRNNNAVDNLRTKDFQRHHDPYDIDDDILSPEKRKYYQDKIDSLRRIIYSTKTHKYGNRDTEHHRRAMRLPSSVDEALRRPSKGHLEHFDIRESSRYLHGY